MKKEPDFVIAGAPKAGTTALCEYLGNDPKIFMTTPKELDFFIKKRTSDDVDDYLGYFKNADNLLAGEGSVSYLSGSEYSAPQLKQYFPNLKLVFLLRNPIDRYVSDFWFYVNKGTVINESNLFDDLLFGRKTLDIHRERIDFKNYLLERGMYAKHLKRFFEHFDSTAIHIIYFEDFVKDQKNTIKKLYEFLGIDYKHPVEIVKQSNKTMYPGKLMPLFVLWKKIKKFLPKKIVNNKEFKDKLLGIKNLFYSNNKPKLSQEARLELKNIYNDSIKDLERIVKRDLTHWQ